MIIVHAVLSFRQDAESSRFVAEKILQQAATESLISSPGFKASKSKAPSSSQALKCPDVVTECEIRTMPPLCSAPRELLRRPLEVKAFARSIWSHSLFTEMRR